MCAPKIPRCAPARSQKVLIQRLGLLGGGGRDEARPVAATRVAVQRELAHAQDLALAQRLVHVPVAVGEDAQRAYLPGQALGGRGVVLAGDAQQHEQARSDLGDEPIVDPHGGAGDPLHERAHRRAVSHPRTCSRGFLVEFLPAKLQLFARRVESVACARAAIIWPWAPASA